MEMDRRRAFRFRIAVPLPCRLECNSPPGSEFRCRGSRNNRRATPAPRAGRSIHACCLRTGAFLSLRERQRLKPLDFLFLTARLKPCPTKPTVLCGHWRFSGETLCALANRSLLDLFLVIYAL